MTQEQSLPMSSLRDAPHVARSAEHYTLHIFRDKDLTGPQRAEVVRFHQDHCQSGPISCPSHAICHWVVAENPQGHVSGLLMMTQHETLTEIYNVCVHRDARRHGLGRRLLRHGLAHVSGRVYVLGIDVSRPEWDHLLPFYVSVGFVPSHVARHMPSGLTTSFDILIMFMYPPEAHPDAMEVDTTEQLARQSEQNVQLGHHIVAEAHALCQATIIIQSSTWRQWRHYIEAEDHETAGPLATVYRTASGDYLTDIVPESTVMPIKHGRREADHRVLLKEYRLSWHTHPHICYRDYRCYLGWPSAGDMQELLKPQWIQHLLCHWVLTVEGVYSIQLDTSWQLVLQSWLEEGHLEYLRDLTEYVVYRAKEYQEFRYGKNYEACLDAQGNPSYELDCLRVETEKRAYYLRRYLTFANGLSLDDMLRPLTGPSAKHPLWDDLKSQLPMFLPLFHVTYIPASTLSAGNVTYTLRYKPEQLSLSSCTLPLSGSADDPEWPADPALEKIQVKYLGLRSEPRYIDFQLTDVLQAITSDRFLRLGQGQCNLAHIFDNVTILETTSASRTSQAFVDIRPGVSLDVLTSYLDKRQRQHLDARLFIKLMPTYQDVITELEYEIIMYKYFLDALLKTRVTPNIMELVMVLSCPTLVEDMIQGSKDPTLPSALRLKYKTMVEEWYYGRSRGDLQDLSAGHLLVIESGSGFTLRQFLDAQRRGVMNREIIHGILFQVLYTINEFYLGSVRHNDLHLTNIFLQLHEQPLTMVYFYTVPNTDTIWQLTIRTKYLVKIYDFDRATFVNFPGRQNKISNPHTQGTYCSQLGECDRPDRLFDMFRFTSLLLPQLQDSAYTLALLDALYPNALTSNPLIVRDTAGKISFFNKGRWCAKDPTTQHCLDTPVPAEYIRNFDQLLTETNIFEGYATQHSLLTLEDTLPDVGDADVYVSQLIHDPLRQRLFGFMQGQ